MIDRGIVSNLVDPSREFELGAITTEGVVNLDEDLLGEVEGRFVVPDHPIKESGDWTLVAADEFFEAAVEAVDGDGHEFAVARARQITRKDLGNGGSRSVHDTGVLRSDVRLCFNPVSRFVSTRSEEHTSNSSHIPLS